METVDAVIPVWRPDRRLYMCVSRLLEQSYPIRSITLILSIDENKKEAWVQETEEILGRNERVVIEKADKREFNHGGTRHRWAEKSDADILLFMVQDAVPADNMLAEHLAGALQDRQNAVVYARHLPDGRCDAIEEYMRYFSYPPVSSRKLLKDIKKSGVRGCFASNVCAAYRREWYEKAGGFERNISLSEDSVFAAKVLKCGAAVIYLSSARVVHAHSFSFRTQWKRNFDIGVVHKKYEDIFGGTFPEAAGAKLMIGSAHYLIKNKKLWLLPKLFCLGVIKMCAYGAGKHYNRLPKLLVRSWALDKRYWEET